MLIDTHAHVNFSAYKSDADEVIRRSLDSDTWIINVGSQYSTSKKAVELAEKYEKGVYAAVGLHPIHMEDGFDYEKYKQLAQSPGVVAIGEIGLDYKEEYVIFKEKQKDIFLQQLELAREMNLPIIFHCRKAHADLIKTINSNNSTSMKKLLKGVVHCFSGSWKEARQYLEMGFYLGFNGIIFKLNLNETIKKTPLDNILIETDCPYLTPPQVQGRVAETLSNLPPRVASRRSLNEPIYVKYVAEKIAEIKNITLKEVAQVTTENAKKLFKI